MNIRLKRLIQTRFGLILVALTVTPVGQASGWQPASESFPIESNLKVGVAKIDITPPPDTKVVGHVRPTQEPATPSGQRSCCSTMANQSRHRNVRPDIRLG